MRSADLTASRPAYARRVPFLLALLVSVSAALFTAFGSFSGVERLLYDRLLSLAPLKASPDTVIVAIDEASLNALGRWPWSRRYHTELMGRLAGADAIFFDIIFAEPEQSGEMQAEPGAVGPAASVTDIDFGSAIGEHGSVVLPVEFEPMYLGGPLTEVLPQPILAKAAAAMGHVQMHYDGDGISRGVYLREGVGKPFWLHAAATFAGLVDEYESVALSAEQSAHRSVFSVYSDEFRAIRFLGPAGTVATVSYIDVMRGTIAPGLWRGKRVLVGATAQGIGDYIPTPLGLMAGVEYHANVYESVRSSAFITMLPSWAAILINGGVALFVALFLSRLAPSRFLLISVASLLVMGVGSAALFLLQSIWLSPAPVVAAVIMFYPLWSWRRIELALAFLRDELSSLKGSSLDRKSTIALLEEQLRSLEQIGALQDWKLGSSMVTGDELWPAFFKLNRRVVVNFELSGRVSRLEFETDSSTGTVEQLLEALLPKAGSVVGEEDSYELVERTIAEIYQVRGEAQRTQSRLNDSLAQLQDAVVIANMAGAVLFANSTALNLFGNDLERSNIVSLSEHFWRQDWSSLVAELLLERKPLYLELDHEREKKLLCQAAALKGDQQVVVLVFTDVSRLRSLEQSKNEALAFLSHDMRSPIVSLLSLIETHRQPGMQAVDGEADVASLMSRVEHFARRSLKYSEDFLQLARAENIDEEVFQPVDMHGVIDGAVAETYALAQNRQVGVSIERPADDCWVMGDTQLLERSIANLLSNAITHSDSDSVVGVSLRLLDEGVAVAVIDRGPGIEPELLPQLFEPYFRARRRSLSDSTREPRSFGLGLSFVDTVAKRHGGSVRVKSRLGVGTTFTLELPAVAID